MNAVSGQTNANSGFAFSTLGCSGASLSAIVSTAGRSGCQGLELRVSDDEFLGLGATEAAAREARESLTSMGLAVIALTSYVGLAAPFPADGPDAELSNLTVLLHLAAALGAPGVRVFIRDIDDVLGNSAVPTAGESRALFRLRQILPVCEKTGTTVFVETHDSHSTGRRMASFFQRVDAACPGHPFRIIWDCAHSWAGGEDPAQSLELLLPWLAYVQIKDVLSRRDPEPVLPGSGTYPIEDLARAVKNTGWRGWVCLEWERKWHPDLPPIDVALEATRSWASALLATQGIS